MTEIIVFVGCTLMSGLALNNLINREGNVLDGIVFAVCSGIAFNILLQGVN